MKPASLSISEARKLLAPKAKRKHKYNAKSTVVNGVRFPSIAEAKHWMALCVRERAGEIMRLQRQVPYELHAGSSGKVVGKIVIDFQYDERRKSGIWYTILDDVKGITTDLAAWKLKHLAAEYPFEVRITRRASGRGRA